MKYTDRKEQTEFPPRSPASRQSTEFQEGTASRGPKLDIINRFMIVVAAVLTFFLLYASIQITKAYTEMRTAMEHYITCVNAATNMQAGSDYLTEQVRVFTITADPENVSNYFREVRETRRRDNAVADVEDLMIGDAEASRYMETALSWSDELKQLEIYAMRLTVEQSGQNPADYPSEIRDCVLRPEDAALSPEAKRDLARDMVFNQNYQDYKRNITENISLCVDDLLSSTKQQQETSSAHLMLVLRNQHILIGLLLISVLIMVFMTSYFIIRPLQKSIAHIQEHQFLPMAGSYEFQVLAQNYNYMFKHTQAQTEQLSYEATHDALTGLFNRSAFDSFRAADLGGSMSLLLVDADKFKEINDGYGHATGDKILMKIATTLRDCFRTEDYICRIGGDEFAVIMVHSGCAMEGVIRDKVALANKRLSDTSDGLPPTSLSVGVAFSDRMNPGEDIFKDADAALYRVKEAGRCGVAFY